MRQTEIGKWYWNDTGLTLGTPDGKVCAVGAFFIAFCVPKWRWDDCTTPQTVREAGSIHHCLCLKTYTPKQWIYMFPAQILWARRPLGSSNTTLASTAKGDNCDYRISHGVSVTDTPRGLHHRVNSVIERNCCILKTTDTKRNTQAHLPMHTLTQQYLPLSMNLLYGEDTEVLVQWHLQVK